MNTIILNSHPIQYLAPLYKYWSENAGNLEVWYCSDESLSSNHDPGFNKKIKWDINLLEGYSYRFFRNYSPIASIHKGFFGLINFGVIKALSKEPKSLIVVHGWGYLTHVLTLFFAWFYGHKVALRGETPNIQEDLKPRFPTLLKHAYLRFLFFFVGTFLYIGKENKKFYIRLGQKQKKFVFAPYCVDNARFQREAGLLLKDEAKTLFGIAPENFTILFCGKYIYKKRPLDLLKAFKLANIANATLVMVGEGELRLEMEAYIRANHLQEQVILTGFINQSDLYKYYRAADVFVMCSGLGETWGLSVNEAMNFGLPLIISDITGCSSDLVKSNGYVYPCGDVSKLASLILRIANNNIEKNTKMSKESLKIIKNYSFEVVVANNKTMTSQC
ncbi:glycosyltransferase family 4 protein [uncultured Pedobacter sp.]|uniref:glycosyltransferase family 4 protein n=1 Tax=uncultured Pedobacter sp. TaxID=246139 RepID=UPI0025DD38A8|nr:glycosyltransferase family 4 protein [uncultured Pedobacter sp.]